MAPPSTWPTGWCGGRCSSLGTWRCTRALAATPWRASEGAGVWRTAPGRRLPHAEVERHPARAFGERTLPLFNRDTSRFLIYCPSCSVTSCRWSASLALLWTAALTQQRCFFSMYGVDISVPALCPSVTYVGSKWSHQEVSPRYVCAFSSRNQCSLGKDVVVVVDLKTFLCTRRTLNSSMKEETTLVTPSS